MRPTATIIQVRQYVNNNAIWYVAITKRGSKLCCTKLNTFIHNTMQEKDTLGDPFPHIWTLKESVYHQIEQIYYRKQKDPTTNVTLRFVGLLPTVF